MRLIIVLILVISTLGATCGKGGLNLNNENCHYPAYIEGCFRYAADNTCATCEYSTNLSYTDYELQNGECLYAPNELAEDCCEQFDANSRCLRCARGLIPNPASGICEDAKIQGCILKNQEGCEVCAEEYDLVSGICVPSIPRCVRYNQQLRCVECAGQSTLVLGACAPQVEVQKILNCITQNEFGCAKCVDGYRVDPQGNCQVGSAGVLIYSPTGEALVCDSPSFRLVNGRCISNGCTNFQNGICLACDSSVGFQLNNGKCVIANCIYWTENGCTACERGLVAGSWGCRNGVEQVCKICNSNEYLGNDGNCYPKDVLCTNYKDGFCTGCFENYYLSIDKECEPQLPGCIYSNGICASCHSAYTFAANTCFIEGCIELAPNGCIQCDSRLQLIGSICGLPHCLTLNGNFGCRVCASGYQLGQSGVCIEFDPYCETQNSLNKCVKCKEGYQMSESGKCASVKLGCNYVDNRCTSCRAPFVYIPQTESCEIDGCLDYFLGGCTTCAEGYKLLYNSCKIPNCLISKNGKCIECDPDFTFRSDGTCVSKDEFCDKMDEFGTCIKCMERYYYSQKLQKCIKKKPGCSYDSEDNCYACSAPFTQDSGRCIIRGCLNLVEEGCRECEYPFTLTKEKTCTIAFCASFQNGRCASCQSGYSLSDKYLCEKADPFCEQYNPERSSCLRCVKGYTLDRRGKCEYSDEYCSSFDEFGGCVNCDRLYFLNSFGKCQIRDQHCLTYTNGLCSTCRPYYFPRDGICLANLKGCKVQISYEKCQTCESGYKMKNNNCVVEITQLSWNSIDMDFFGDGNKNEGDAETSRNTFTVDYTSTTNLVACLQKQKGSIFYSSTSLNNPLFTLNAAGNNGWTPLQQSSRGQYLGCKTPSLQTFYALDIKQLTGSSLYKFSIEYSMDGTNFITVGEYSFTQIIAGSVETFYFKPVHAQFIRIVVLEGVPNIRIEFYFSSASSLTTTASTDTYISKSVVATIDGAEQGGIKKCPPEGLCWAGAESCEPRALSSFSLVYSSGSKDFVSEVKVEYSLDGIAYLCWNECKPVALKNNSLVFPSTLIAQKVRCHFTKYTGNPQFGIKFTWA